MAFASSSRVDINRSALFKAAHAANVSKTDKSSSVYPIETIVEDAIKRNARRLQHLFLNKKIDFASSPSNILGDSATKEQQEAYQLLLDKETNPIVAILGPGGTGKSQFIEWLQERYRESGRIVDVTATTGYAAHQIKGVTFFRYMNLRPDWYKIATGLDSKNEELDLNQFLKLASFYHRTRTVCDRIVNTDLLIIDEISMIDGPTLLVMDMICRYLRQEPRKPFGGIQCLWSGDFLQLPPVSKVARIHGESKEARESSEKEREQSSTEFVFQYFAWNSIWKPTVKLFTQNVRSIDLRWSELLARMRLGKCNEDDVLLLKSRTRASIVRNKDSPILPSGSILTHVFPHTRRVQEFNEKERRKLKHRDHRFFQPIKLFFGKDEIDTAHPVYQQFCEKMNPEIIVSSSDFSGSSTKTTSSTFFNSHDTFPNVISRFDEYSENILTSYLDDIKYEKHTIFRVGEKVMLRENLFQTNGLVNGSTGQVIGYTNFHNVSKEYYSASIKAMKLKKDAMGISCIQVNPDQYDVEADGFPVIKWSDSDLITFMPFSVRKIQLATVREKKEKDSTALAASSSSSSSSSSASSAEKKDEERDLSICVFILPIQSAAAITSHKCQGLTLPFVFVGNPDKCFEYGMFYVMCSRVRSLNHLFLDDTFDESHIQAHPSAVAFFS